jgi:D-glycero-D-manno-heptose 1,7-bisphosphate phosphatase
MTVDYSAQRSTMKPYRSQATAYESPDRAKELRFGVPIRAKRQLPTAAVFFDRDGVLVETVVKPDGMRAAWSQAEFRLMAGAREAVERIAQAGFPAFVVTNQPDVALGRLGRRAAEQLNALLLTSIPALTAVYACYHCEIDACACRKPRAGLIVQAASEHGVDLHASWLVGDRWVDIAAGQAAGCRTILIQHSASWSPTTSGSPDPRLRPDHVVSEVRAAVDAIIAQSLPMR